MKNVTASIQQRLLNLARQRGEDFQQVLTRYGLERLLYRISISSHAEKFILKGAMLFYLWDNTLHRPTRDMDLMLPIPQDPKELATLFQEVLAQKVEQDDGLRFDGTSLRILEIRDDDSYGGQRVTMQAFLGKSRVPLQVDVGFSDRVTPAAQMAEFPVMLDLPAPQIRVYPIYTVIAEKLEILVRFGQANSRMKDYFDLFYLVQNITLDRMILRQAVEATFQRRQTLLPTETPSGLSPDFAKDSEKQTQWRAFIRKYALAKSADDPLWNLSIVVEELRQFFGPLWENR